MPLKVWLVIFTVLCAAAWSQEKTKEPIDWQEVHELYIMQQIGCPLTPEEQAYLDRAIQIKRQQQNKIKRNKRMQQANIPQPDFADIAYGEHDMNRLDIWLAASEEPAPVYVFIHGGGFRAGSRKNIKPEMLKACLEAGISFASIDYRLSGVAPYPAQMHDSARAIQFIRSKAEEWNIDPKRLAAGGGSAGSGISQWLGYHDDLADPESNDPIERLSTRLSCVIPRNMQSTYDPRVIKEIIPGNAHKNSAMAPFYGKPEGWDWETNEITPELDALIKDASPINHLTPDDCPVFILSNAAAATPGNIHHPNFGKHLAEALEKTGIEYEIHLDTDFENPQEIAAAMVAFLQKHL